MICRICGTDFDDSLKACPNCGEEPSGEITVKAEETAAESYNSSAEAFEKAEKKSLNVGLIAGAAVIAVVIIGIILAAKFIFFNSSDSSLEAAFEKAKAQSFSTNEELTEQAVKFIEENNADGLVSMSSELTGYGLEQLNYSGSVEGFYQELLDGIKEKFEGSLGSGYTLSYKVTDQSTITGDELLKNMENFKQLYPDYDWDNLSEITTVSTNLTAQKGDNKESSSLILMSLNESNSWKLFVLMYY